MIQFRLTHNLTQKELGKFLGVSKAMISKMERGEYNIPHYVLVIMKQLVDEFGVERGLDVTPGKRQYRVPFDSQRIKPNSIVREEEKPQEIIVDDKQDMVELPPKAEHYHEAKIDPIGYGEQLLPDEELLGFYRLNAIKYITRFGRKNGMNEDDLDKAVFYVEKMRGLIK